MLVKDLAALLGCSWEGDGEGELHDVASLEDAGPDTLSFVSNARFIKQATESPAGCLLVPLDFANPSGRTVIRVANPRSAMARAIAKVLPKVRMPPGVHSTAVLGPGVSIDQGVYIGPLASIGAGTRVGAGTSIGAGAVVGDFVHIGENCLIHPRVTIYNNVTLGREVVIHSGTVIGADGFGYIFANRPRDYRRPCGNWSEFLRGSRRAGRDLHRRRNQA